MKKTIISIIVLAVVAVGIWAVVSRPVSTQPDEETGTLPIAQAGYSCNADKTISAAFYDGPSTPATGDQPPVPGGSVHLTLSDGRTLTLAQTISADGTRYANTDDSIVFWNKGNGAFILENNQQTYLGCLKTAPVTAALPNVFASGSEGFSMRYPTGYKVTEPFVYQNLGPDKSIGGVQFVIDPAFAKGTNLGSDSYVSVEQIPNTQECSASLFLSQGATVTSVTDNGTEYSVGSLSDAAAGNRYEETVYATPGTNPCIAVRYFVHYGNIQNYDDGGATKEFDKAALLSQFDAMRRTLVISQ